jgi:hypothetical protein
MLVEVRSMGDHPMWPVRVNITILAILLAGNTMAHRRYRF